MMRFSYNYMLIFLLYSLLAFKAVFSSNYKEGDEVKVYVNKVGPYFNPHETYHYYELPICRPHEIVHKRLSLGEVLDGDRMAESLYKIKFKEPVVKQSLCTFEMALSDCKRLSSFIEDLYYFEMVLDDIPLRGFVGHLEEGSLFPHTHEIHLWTHHTFNILYNDNEIVYANISVQDGEAVDLKNIPHLPSDIHFTYSVNWIATQYTIDDRGMLLQGSAFFPKSLEVHWLSIINSMVLVFLLVGFVAIIMTRILRHDFQRYNDDDAERDVDDASDNGWKMVHTDVFRFPPAKSLFCAILGVGTQFLVLCTSIIVMAVLGMFNVHQHGSINSAGLLLFAFTSCSFNPVLPGVAGYTAGKMYRQLGGEAWVWNINLTAVLFAGPFFFVWSVLNSVEWAHGSTQALPWTTVLMIGALWAFMATSSTLLDSTNFTVTVGYPLTVLGGIFGKNWTGSFEAPCRTRMIAREIPRLPCYKGRLMHCVIGGFLPFSAISVELYYIFATLWGREPYTLYGILFIVYAIALSVTACISVTLTYFQLSAEDYRWWWRSVFSGGMAGAFVFLYAVFYFVRRSNMSGLLQTLEFFGYTSLVCYVFFLMLGTVSFFSALTFIQYIYVNIKMD